MNSQGQLGLGGYNTTSITAPVAVATSYKFDKLACGGSHTCGLTISQEIVCWGANGDGQLGSSPLTTTFTPKLVSGQKKYQSVTAASDHTLALEYPSSQPSKAYTWGECGCLRAGCVWQQPGEPLASGDVQARVPPSARGPYGMAHTPSFTRDQLAVKTRLPKKAHMQLPGALACLALSHGGRPALPFLPCATSCAGYNYAGALGDGTTVDKFVPTEVSGNMLFAQVSAGNGHMCGVLYTGVALCWGEKT